MCAIEIALSRKSLLLSVSPTICRSDIFLEDIQGEGEGVPHPLDPPRDLLFYLGPTIAFSSSTGHDDGGKDGRKVVGKLALGEIAVLLQMY